MVLRTFGRGVSPSSLGKELQHHLGERLVEEEGGQKEDPQDLRCLFCLSLRAWGFGVLFCVIYCWLENSILDYLLGFFCCLSAEILSALKMGYCFVIAGVRGLGAEGF